MATVERARTERRFLVSGVSWRTYESLLADLSDRPAPRVTYDRGRLELMSPSKEHEQGARLLGRMIDIWTCEKNIPLRGTRSMTFKRADMDCGLEADESYYIRSEALIRSTDEIDLAIDPPPDLAIEVEVSSSSIEKLDVYSSLGVSEVWRFDGASLRVYELTRHGAYVARDDSLNLPDFPVGDVAAWVARAKATDETAWARSFQSWVREH